MALWCLSTVVALLEIVLFAEMAVMFPNKPGRSLCTALKHD
jgi:hypothetical protein